MFASIANPAASPSSLNIRFNDIPVTEAKANGDSAVWEFTGAANADETGAGGGLTGLDLVLYQYGGVPGAANGGRSLTAGSMYFKPTANMINAFNLAANLTVIYQCSHLTADGQLGYPNLDNKFYWYGSPLTTVALNSVGPAASTSLRCGCSGPAAYPDNSIFWHVLTLNYTDGIGFSGISVKDTLPNKISDFIGTSFFNNAVHTFTSTTTWSPIYQAIVGDSYNNQSAQYKIRSLTLSKLPFVSKV
jgi:hypothetical protein